MKHFIYQLLLLSLLILTTASKSQTVTLLSEDFSSNTFTTNGWNFPNGQSPWSVNNFYTPTVATTPNALCFTSPAALSNYSVPMVSSTINATGVTGPVFFSCALRLQNTTSNATGLEQFDIEYKNLASSTWSTIASYSNSVPGNNQNFSVNNFILAGMSGQNFQIRFSAHGVNSTHVSGWGLDNIVVIGVTCPSSLPSLSVNATPTICSGSTTTITASGGGPSYTWAPGGEQTSSIVVTPTTTTSYALLSSYPGCTTTPVSAIVTVTVVANPSTLTAAASSSSLCSGGTVTLSASGASTYTWNPGSSGSTISVSPTVSTIYTVTSTNSINCKNTETLGITVKATPTVSIFSSTNTICNGGTANLIASGAPSFSWNTGGTNAIYPVTPIVTTTYVATGTSTAGCSSSNSLVIFVSPTVTALASSSAICVGNSATLSASSAVTYTWNGTSQSNSIIVTPVNTSVYSVSATNSQGCESTQTLTLVVHQNPTVTIVASSTAICAGNSATLSATGASSYSWGSSGTSSVLIVSPASYTTYSVSGVSAEGCTGSTSQATVALLVNALPNLSVVASPVIVCAGNSSTLSASGALNYAWNGGPPSSSQIVVNPQQTSVYTVTGTDANNCSQSKTLSLAVNPTPTVTIVASATAVCAGTSVTLLGGGASTYTWNTTTPQQVLSFVAMTTVSHSLEATDVNGCKETQTIQIVVYPNPVILLTASHPSVCSGQTVQLVATGATAYSWNTNQIGTSITVTPSSTGTYSVTGSDGNNCSSNASISILVSPSPFVNAGSSSSVICAGEPVTLFANGASSYSWSTGQIADSIIVYPMNDSLFVVEGSNVNGCKTSVSLLQIVDACTGLMALNKVNGIKLYPNPSSGLFRLTGGSADTATWLFVSDLTGKIVFDKTNMKGISQIDLSEFSNGIYFLTIGDGRWHHTIKLIKN